MTDLARVTVFALSAAGIYALVALSVVFVYRSTSTLNFAAGHVAIFAGLFYANWTGPLLLRVAFATILGGLVGLAIYYGSVYLAVKREAHHIAVAIATLGAALVLEYFAGVFWAKTSFTAPPFVSGQVSILGASVPMQRLVSIVIVVVIVALVAWFMDSTMMGHGLNAVAYSTDVSHSYGVSVAKLLPLAWAVGGLLAGMAGILLTSLSAVSRGQALPLAVGGLVAAVLGGLGSIRGALVGALVVGFAEGIFVRYVSPTFATAIVFVAVFAVLSFRPGGLMGRHVLGSEGT